MVHQPMGGPASCFNIFMRALLLILPFLFVSALFPQATTNEFYLYSALQGDPAYTYGTVRIDPSLELVRDPSGTAHLAVEPNLASLAGVQLVVPVHGEIPAPSAPGGTSLIWTLFHTPVYGATCFRNGVLQTPGSDYTIAGNVITAPAWKQGDILLCDFEHY
jgi:hypothetical protein